jgi:alanyl-tRNA synthetase
MQYEKKDGKIIGNLPKPSVDTGAGLERLAMTMQGVDNIYDTEPFKYILEEIESRSNNYSLKLSEQLKSARIVADHIRAAVFLIGDGVKASNTDRGYVLRKIIRRAVRHADQLGLSYKAQDRSFKSDIYIVAIVCIKEYKNVYPYLESQCQTILDEIESEEIKFRETLKLGLKEFEKGVDAFTLFSSYGFPLELTLELAKEKGIKIDTKDFEERFKAHQSLSRSGASQRFKGGLADANDPMIVRYHTATHLLHQALHDVLGDSVMQKGSNITAERLRFDFAHGTKMTDEEKKRVEDIVNEKIAAKLPVNQVIMPRAEAEKTGARHFFGEKYGDEISIYFVGNDLSSAYSKEFCGGPHVKNTGELAGPEGKWRFKIQKEEAVAQGVRRIKAVLG